jgi:hypothetical protein
MSYIEATIDDALLVKANNRKYEARNSIETTASKLVKQNNIDFYSLI